MEALLVSAGVVALAEFGDKTQLFALVLSARYRQPLPIIAGIACATLANHLLAGVVGTWLAARIGPNALRWILGLGFIAMAAWTLIPDSLAETRARPSRHGVFGTTLLGFFLLEMGDKTQIATLALAARFHDLVAVVAGTTAGMLIADVPAVLIGDAVAHRLPMKLLHGIAAVLYLALGISLLLGAGAA